MDKANIDRINELSRLSRVRELTESEKLERSERRTAYLKAFRERFRSQLDNTVIEYEDGTTVELKDRNKKR